MAWSCKATIGYVARAGSCGTWFFRKVETNWKLVGPKNYALLVSTFGFLSVKHNNLYDLVITNPESDGSDSVELWEFNGTEYESNGSYCQRGEGYIVLGECE